MYRASIDKQTPYNMDSKRKRGRVGVDQRREVAALQHFRRDQVPMPLVASGMWGRLGVTKGVIGGRKGYVRHK